MIFRSHPSIATLRFPRSCFFDNTFNPRHHYLEDHLPKQCHCQFILLTFTLVFHCQFRFKDLIHLISYIYTLKKHLQWHYPFGCRVHTIWLFDTNQQSQSPSFVASLIHFLHNQCKDSWSFRIKGPVILNLYFLTHAWLCHGFNILLISFK